RLVATPREPARELLKRTRFLTLTLWIVVLYFVLPMNFFGLFLFQRMPALAVMLLPAVLPAPLPSRKLLVQVLVGGLAAMQLLLTTTDFLVFEQEQAGVKQIIQQAEPGRTVAGLMYQRSSRGATTSTPFLHFPALYQAYKGGRISLSFAEYYASIVQYRPGQSWDDLVTEFDEYTPRRFKFERHGGRFDYFLVHAPGEALAKIFEGHLDELESMSAGRWHLLRRKLARPAQARETQPR